MALLPHKAPHAEPNDQELRAAEGARGVTRLHRAAAARARARHTTRPPAQTRRAAAAAVRTGSSYGRRLKRTMPVMRLNSSRSTPTVIATHAVTPCATTTCPPAIITVFSVFLVLVFFV